MRCEGEASNKSLPTWLTGSKIVVDFVSAKLSVWRLEDTAKSFSLGYIYSIASTKLFVATETLALLASVG